MEYSLKSQRGKSKFAHNGFIYVFDRLSSNGEKEFWRCEQKHHHCKARIHVCGGEVIKTINYHSHDESAAKIEADSVVTKIKDRAGVTMEGPVQVINECCEDLTQAGQGILPNQAALKKCVRRQRNKVRAAPPNPIDRRHIVIPEEYKMYQVQPGVEEDFMLFDSGPTDDRIIIFGRKENLNILKRSKHWFVDGTFKITPPLFYQVFVILGEEFGGVHLVLYALLPGKQKITYDQVFKSVKDLIGDVQPTSVSCDFELAIIKSLKECFPKTNIFGCFFHLNQNMKKHLGELHLLRQYKNDGNFALKAKMIISLAFVPPSDLDTAFDLLAEDLPENLHPLLDWFEDNYIGRMNRRGNGRRPAMFPPEIWNLYERTKNGDHRTNNHAEAAHRRLQCELGVEHPTLWKFINTLKKVQKNRDTFYEQCVASRPPPQKLKKYAEADKRILSLTSGYDNSNVLSYLRGIAHNFNMSG